MRFEVAPLLHRRLVAPDGERQDLSGLREALEALDRDEAVDLRKQGLQLAAIARYSSLRPALGSTSKITAIMAPPSPGMSSLPRV
jgi:hypothetical protein